jgi:hypothetical protein
MDRRLNPRIFDPGTATTIGMGQPDRDSRQKAQPGVFDRNYVTDSKPLLKGKRTGPASPRESCAEPEVNGWRQVSRRLTGC